MKRTVIFIFLLASGIAVFGQATDTTTNKPAKRKASDARIVTSASNILLAIGANGNLTTLLNAINAAGLVETFNGTGPITVFAPTNKAFDQLPAGKLDTLLLPVHKAELANLISYHVIAGKVSSKDIYAQIKAGNGQAMFKTISGGTLTASINTNRNIVLTDENGGQSVISRLDIKQANGMLFTVTAVLSPKITP